MDFCHIKIHFVASEDPPEYEMKVAAVVILIALDIM